MELIKDLFNVVRTRTY